VASGSRALFAAEQRNDACGQAHRGIVTLRLPSHEILRIDPKLEFLHHGRSRSRMSRAEVDSFGAHLPAPLGPLVVSHHPVPVRAAENGRRRPGPRPC
jgi:hypothetical protein